MNSDSNDSLHPDKAIRRFDVFAEYTRLERRDKGYKADEAKGYGIWLAKVVASRTINKSGESTSSSGKKKPGPEPTFREIGEELQTDETFDHDIVDRMGTKLYSRIFAPAIGDARERGETYEEIRDSIRKDWKPKKRTAGK
jgi:hypothetical protein